MSLNMGPFSGVLKVLCYLRWKSCFLYYSGVEGFHRQWSLINECYSLSRWWRVIKQLLILFLLIFLSRWRYVLKNTLFKVFQQTFQNLSNHVMLNHKLYEVVRFRYNQHWKILNLLYKHQLNAHFYAKLVLTFILQFNDKHRRTSTYYAFKIELNFNFSCLLWCVLTYE